MGKGRPTEQGPPNPNEEIKSLVDGLVRQVYRGIMQGEDVKTKELLDIDWHDDEEISSIKNIRNAIALLEMSLDQEVTKRALSRKGKKGILIHVGNTTDERLKLMGKTLNLTTEYLVHRAIYLLFKDAGIDIPSELEERLARPAIHVGGRPKKIRPSSGD